MENNDDGLSENPEEEDPLIIVSMTTALLMHIWSAAPSLELFGEMQTTLNLRTLFNKACTLIHCCHFEP